MAMRLGLNGKKQIVLHIYNAIIHNKIIIFY